MACRLQGLGFRVKSVGFRVWIFGFWIVFCVLMTAVAIIVPEIVKPVSEPVSMESSKAFSTGEPELQHGKALALTQYGGFPRLGLAFLGIPLIIGILVFWVRLSGPSFGKLSPFIKGTTELRVGRKR